MLSGDRSAMAHMSADALLTVRGPPTPLLGVYNVLGPHDLMTGPLAKISADFSEKCAELAGFTPVKIYVPAPMPPPPSTESGTFADSGEDPLGQHLCFYMQFATREQCDQALVALQNLCYNGHVVLLGFASPSVLATGAPGARQMGRKAKINAPDEPVPGAHPEFESEVQALPQPPIEEPSVLAHVTVEAVAGHGSMVSDSRFQDDQW
jgi:hypothetical protein